MERIAPAPKDQPVSFSLPKMKNALDASEAAGSVLTAVSEGKLTPIEATRVMGIIDSYRRTLELTEIEQRLQALEANQNALQLPPANAIPVFLLLPNALNVETKSALFIKNDNDASFLLFTIVNR